MKKISLLLAACMLLVSIAGCSNKKSDDNVLRIGMMSSSDVIPYALIQKNGLDKKYDIQLQLEVFTSAKDRDAAFQAGELDGVLADIISICLYQTAGFDVKITGITDGDYILMAGKDTGITQVSEIEGRTIAISENTLIDFVLDELLLANGMESNSVVKEVVPRIPDRLELLREGKIELGLMPEPFATLALADGAINLGTANGIGLYPAISAFSQEALDSKGDAVKRLYDAYNEAVEYMNTTPLADYEANVIAAVGYPEEMVGKVEVKEFRKSVLPAPELVAKTVAWASQKGLCSPELSYEEMTFDVYAK